MHDDLTSPPAPERPVTVELWRAPVPLARPIVTPAGTYDTYHHLVVRALDEDGREGWGLAAAVTSAEIDATLERVHALLGASRPGLAGLIEVEQVEATRRVTPPDRWSRWAACALATAGWDLRARQRGVACAELWAPGSREGRLSCYASGLFLSSSTEELDAEAERHRAAGFTIVKMRTGLAVDEDLARLEVVRRWFPEPGSIAVDSVNAWTPEQTAAFVDGAGPLLWVEDPVPLDELATAVELLAGRPALVAAGESLIEAEELLELRTGAGLGAVLLDVQQVGGPRRFLEIAARLAAVGARVGAHIFTPVSTHLLACVEDPLPVEVFDWSDPLWRTPPTPDADGMLAVAGPGLGVELDLDTLRGLDRQVAVVSR